MEKLIELLDRLILDIEEIKKHLKDKRLMSKEEIKKEDKKKNTFHI